MQTIYLDISNKGVVPTIYAKQGDVGRKFEVIFTNSGLPYVPPDGSVFSVWYSGQSGEGNYTDIGDNSAFSINENKVTVELIAQMLTNDGSGILCIVLNESNGNQIGSWNIPYLCEKVPGIESEAAKEYYTAFSKAVEGLKQVTENLTPEAIGARPNTWLPTIAEIGAAPASLADYTPKGGRKNFCTNLLHVDLDNPDAYQNLAGVISAEDASTLVDSPVTSGAFYAYREVLFINSQVGNRPKVIVRLTEAYPQQNNVWINSYNPDSNTWSGWCWSSPPMRFGVEYRTTELWNDKTVYTMLFNTGELANGGTFTYKIGSVNVVRYSASAGGAALPIHAADSCGASWSLWCDVSSTTVTAYMGGSRPTSALDVQVWYTID